MKIGLIYQPCGLGDILFLQKIAYHIKSLGYEIYWPVISEFANIGHYIEDFNFISWEDNINHINGPPLPDSVNFPRKDYYLPSNPTSIKDDLFFFQGFVDVNPIMGGKYDSIGLEYDNWANYIKFTRDIDKENELYYDILGLKDNDEYVFVNRYFQMRPQISYYEGISNNPNDYGLKVVELTLIEGFTAFDWCKVFENAKEINMIETSFNFILESPQLFDIMKEKKLTLHSRIGSFHEVDYLFKLPWSYA
jgi:hypothetical protein